MSPSQLYLVDSECQDNLVHIILNLWPLDPRVQYLEGDGDREKKRWGRHGVERQAAHPPGVSLGCLAVTAGHSHCWEVGGLQGQKNPCSNLLFYSSSGHSGELRKQFNLSRLQLLTS